MRRAILHEDSDKPLLIWMPDNEETEDEDKYVSGPLLDISHELDVPSHELKIGFIMLASDNSFLELGSPKEEYVSLVCETKGSGERLVHSISMMLREDHPGCGANQCLIRLARDIGSCFLSPVVLLRQSKVENPLCTFDMGTRHGGTQQRRAPRHQPERPRPVRRPIFTTLRQDADHLPEPRWHYPAGVCRWPFAYDLQAKQRVHFHQGEDSADFIKVQKKTVLNSLRSSRPLRQHSLSS